MAAPMSDAEIEEEITKIRKKLKQIANLERKDHILTHKEKNKITKKSALRKELQALLPFSTKSYQDDEQKKVTLKEKSNSKKSGTKKKQKKISPSLTKNNPSPPTFISTASSEQNPQIHNKYASLSQDFSNNAQDEESSQDGEEEEESEEGDDYEVQMADIIVESQMKNMNTKAQQIEQKSAETAPNINIPQPQLNPLKPKWRQKECIVDWLEGHNDLVTAVDFCGDILVTASRDTTIKSWDIKCRSLIRSYGGHTESVTCIVALSKSSAEELQKLLELTSNDNIIITGSTDCSFKIWSLETGEIIKSVYTYNPITSLVYSNDKHFLITASGGGKLELWDLVTSTNIHSIRNHEDAITCLAYKDNLVYSGSADGIIKIYEIQEKKLSCVFESEDVKTEQGISLTNRYVRCITVCNDLIYYGDDAVNIKAINWRKGLVNKYLNHVEEFASTDAVCIYDDLMISSSFDLDHGLGYLNVRQLPSCEYLFSLNDEETERITSITSTVLSNGDLVLITGGPQLKLWHFINTSRVTNDDLPRIKLKYIKQLSIASRDSDNYESDEDESEDEEDESDVGRARSRKRLQLDDQKPASSWSSWCNIL
ncbi:hypothetical protein SNE40_014522 [Patella caerulea]|uniref:LRRK2 beta-propeller domain-containing protein n=1 Tax=Patella caerulea TaxID=87958 RepID=A0AAN8JI64_PATCE